ncbi:hypothetical protein MUG10_13075 [Xanthomonas prunicola]|uniref:hypothetical protein n=1 Tax=Xanthomonas prunicola TaxID=2053930 RepID=UPI0020785765|nr:hypothetical protein [Xanthomonas prunicola]USJ02969.1 hypothetical protein MUG10_13075 [Xanthomonas prunicola]
MLLQLQLLRKRRLAKGIDVLLGDDHCALLWRDRIMDLRALRVLAMLYSHAHPDLPQVLIACEATGFDDVLPGSDAQSVVLGRLHVCMSACLCVCVSACLHARGPGS